MQDTLDLVQIRHEAAKLKRNAQRRWIILAFILILMICQFPTLATFATFSDVRQPRDFECEESAICSMSVQICVQTPTVLILGSFLVLGLNWWRQRKPVPVDKLKLDLPPVSPHPLFTPFNIIAVLWILFWLVLSANFPDLGLLPPLMFIVPAIIAFLLNFMVKQPLQRCNFDEVIRRVQFARKNFGLGNDPGLTSLEGLALMQAGRAEESEKKNLQFVAETKKLHLFEAHALNNLGCELVLQERYDEAIVILENAILMQPTLGVAYDSLASVYLESGSNAQRALELAEMAVTYAPRGTSTTLIHATLARALALCGYASRAEVTLEQAFKKADKKHCWVMSELYRLAGHTMQALNNQTEAREHFIKAIQLNQYGRVGKMAQQALDDLHPS